MRVLYPWWRFNCQYLEACCRKERLPVVLILAGMQGLGKKMYAAEFINYYFSASDSGKFNLGGDPGKISLAGHPDFHLVDNGNDNSVGVDEVRDLAGFMRIRPQFSQRKIIQINYANKLTVAAQNACLKMMDQEQVPGLWILVTASLQEIIAPVQSRAMVLNFGCPSREDLRESGWSHERLQRDYNAVRFGLLPAIGGDDEHEEFSEFKFLHARNSCGYGYSELVGLSASLGVGRFLRLVAVDVASKLQDSLLASDMNMVDYYSKLYDRANYLVSIIQAGVVLSGRTIVSILLFGGKVDCAERLG